jgi:hypothetical protein
MLRLSCNPYFRILQYSSVSYSISSVISIPFRIRIIRMEGSHTGLVFTESHYSEHWVVSFSFVLFHLPTDKTISITESVTDYLPIQTLAQKKTPPRRDTSPSLLKKMTWVCCKFWGRAVDERGRFKPVYPFVSIIAKSLGCR